MRPFFDSALQAIRTSLSVVHCDLRWTTALCLIGGMLLSSSTAVQYEYEEGILWTATPLTWPDFKGEAPGHSPHQAVTSCQVRSGNYYPSRDTVEYDVSCVFIPSSSWVRQESLDDEILLAHEQVHFDISEYSARVFRWRLSTREVSIDHCNSTLLHLRDSIGVMNREIQKRYDRETEHGIRPSAQRAWRIKVDSLLASKENYAAVVFRVPLKSD